jgi:hypothetical protein
MKQRRMRTLAILGLLVQTCCAVGAAWGIDADPISEGSWTMVLLPDTQYYSSTYPAIFNSQTQWIADHRTSHNIKMVLHQGDVTDNHSTTQFNRAKTALGILESASVPYSVAPGNHDYTLSSRSSPFNYTTYFGPGSAYASQSRFSGSAGGFFESGKTDNSYCTFNAGGKDWLVFSTEFGPRDEVVAWMNTVATAHPNHNLILNTHAYLYADERHDWATYGEDQGGNPHAYNPLGTENDGQELWDKLVKKYENWKFVFCGHMTTGRLTSEGNNQNLVHELMADYQSRSNGGDGYLRIMEFLADGNTVKVSTYSPYQGAYLTTSDQQFTLKMRPDNYVPVAASDAYAGNEDASISVAVGDGVLANDIDRDGDPLITFLVAGPNHGSLNLSQTGELTYTPSANYHGADSFTYKAYDGKAYSNVSTVTLNVASVNDAPMAADDAYRIEKDTLSVVYSYRGVLANDADADNTDNDWNNNVTLTAELESSTSHGTLSFYSSGAFIYTPATGFCGMDSFTYRASDGELYSELATVLLEVYAPIQVPGDATGDGLVNQADASILASHWGHGGETWTTGDFNGDGVVGPADASILAANWSATAGEADGTSVPEPSTAAVMLALLFGLGLIRRRNAVRSERT